MNQHLPRRSGPRARVALTAAAVPGVAGGIELWCARAAGALRARGFDVVIVTSEYDPGSSQQAARILRDNYARYGMEERLADVPIVGLGTDGRPPSWASEARVAAFFGNQVAALEADVIFPNEIRLAWHCAAGAARLGVKTRIALMVHTDSEEVYHTIERHHWLAAASAGVSSRITSELRRRFGVAAAVIPYGVDTTEVEPLVPRSPHGPLRLGFVGRIREKHKGVMLLPDVLSIVRSRGIEAECWIAGEGPDDGALRERVAKSGNSAFVRWFGAVPAHDVPPIVASLDVLLMPSRLEGISIAMLEAMAQGVVPVVAPVSGMADAIDGRNGVILRDRSAAEMADACVALARDRNRLREMSAAARLTATERYGEERHWDRMAEFIDGAVAASPRHWPRDRHPNGDAVGRTHRLIPEPLGTLVRRIASLHRF